MITLKNDIHIRWLLARDWPKVRLLEATSGVSPRVTQDEWTSIFMTEGRVGMCAYTWPDERILGYVLYDPKAGLAADDSFHLEIHRLFVGMAFRRQGVGRALMDRLSERIFPPCEGIGVVLPERRLDLIAFFQRAGFRGASVERDRFGEEDGFRFCRPRGTRVGKRSKS